MFVLCSGKSGSMTLHSTFLADGLSSVHAHSEGDYRFQGLKGHLYNDVIPKSIERYGSVYIIDSYRSPIERKISCFFQNIDQFAPDYRRMTIDSLINIFNEVFLTNLENNQSVNEAFDHYGIPRWTSFDFKKGYNIREVDNKVFIKLRFADIDRWGEYLSEIFGRPITMVADNIGENKEYADIYKAFKSQYKLPCSYLLTVTRDTDFNIYTTHKEKLEYIRKWVKNSCR